MEFREYASHETSTVITRLMASQAEAQVRRAREALETAARALDATAEPVGADQEARDLVQRLEAAAGIAIQRVQQEAQKTAGALRAEIAAARQAHGEAQARLEDLRGELSAQTERAASAEADLDATIEAHRQVEAELAGIRELLDSSRREATRLAADLEAEHEHRALLNSDLTAAAEHRGRLEADLTAARAAAAEEAEQRLTLQGELDTARDRLAALEGSRASLQDELDAARDRLAALEELGATLQRDLDGTRETLTALEASRASLLADVEAAQTAAERARTELDTTRADRDRTRGEMRAMRAELEAARAAGDAARAAADAVRVDLDAANAALARASVTVPRAPHVIAVAAACRALGATTSVTDLLSALAAQVSTQFSRAAIFRVKAHHLEGEHAVGFDGTTDVSKLVVPLTLDSLVARAHATGTLTQAGPRDPGGSAPFGGAPHLAVAVPLAFQGEAIAVLYADADDPPAGPHDERPAFAAILAEHATALLARMSQELKTLQELRDYATMLIQEAEQMHAADLESGRSEEDRRTRLRDTIECARQLYTQRASLEGPAAASLLDEQIAAAATATTPFASDLATLTPQDDDRENASRAS
jgi:hypothetical protein